jgi:hypothetical protein
MAVYWISFAGLVIAAGMGLYGMIRPSWASWLVRLRDDPARPGGFAEFRGTYGGLFFGAHAFALFFMWPFLHEREALGPFPTHWVMMGAVGTCGMMWLSTSVGRGISVLLDKTGGGFNYGSLVFEIVLGLMIAGPVIALLFS